MKKLFLLVLATSLTANAWLLLRPPSDLLEARTTAVLPNLAVPKPASALPEAVVQQLTALETADLAALRDAMRAAGVDESSIRGILEGALRARYVVQLDAARAGAGAAGGVRIPSLRESVSDPLKQLLGTDPLDLSDAEARYDFLPPQTRRKLALIDLDYSELRSRLARARSNAATKSELDQQQVLTAERRKDVLAALTTEERAEYDLRFSLAAVRNSRRFATLGVTEQEFRVIQPLIAAMSERGDVPRQPTAPERITLEQQTLDQLVAAVGHDRALDYIWGTYSGPYASTVRVLQEAHAPISNAARLLQLAAETGVEAATIHRDITLTPEQKRAALLTLQQSVRPQLDALVPPNAQPKLDEKAIGWFTMLGAGRYVQPLPVLFGDGYSSSTPAAVTGPATGPRFVVPVPRRSGN